MMDDIKGNQIDDIAARANLPEFRVRLDAREIGSHAIAWFKDGDLYALALEPEISDEQGNSVRELLPFFKALKVKPDQFVAVHIKIYDPPEIE